MKHTLYNFTNTLPLVNSPMALQNLTKSVQPTRYEKESGDYSLRFLFWLLPLTILPLHNMLTLFLSELIGIKIVVVTTLLH